MKNLNLGWLKTYQSVQHYTCLDFGHFVTEIRLSIWKRQSLGLFSLSCGAPVKIAEFFQPLLPEIWLKSFDISKACNVRSISSKSIELKKISGRRKWFYLF
jgi:hypothetical protein